MITKSIDYLNKDIVDILDDYNITLKKIYKEAQNMIKKRWVYIANKKVIYDNLVVALFPDFHDYNLAFYNKTNILDKNEAMSIFINSFRFEDLEWDFMSHKEVNSIFNNIKTYKLNDYGYSVYEPIIEYSMAFCDKDNKIYGFKPDLPMISYFDRLDRCAIIPIYRLNGIDSSKISFIEVLKLWIKNGLIPKNTAYYSEYIKIIELAKNFDLILETDGIKFDKSQIIKDIKENNIDINLNFGGDINVDTNTVINNLLRCDEIRANIEKYDEKILSDPNRGHWEIWDNEINDYGLKAKLDRNIVARNPVYDIKYGGIVGIDFGTKSTVVVYQEDSEHTLPMRVGIGEFRKTVNEKHYENPTVMEFINLEDFLNRYKEKNGRPFTLWEDLTISHAAYNSLLNSKSDDYYSYFSELKQWCGNREKRIRIKDKKNKIYDLPTFLEVDDYGINPVEIYAYYLGLYINNMHTGIFLDYSLAFPVTYEKDIREKILESFRKGLKKSLPEALHNDEEVIKKFKVYQGTSEPAAYAISALQEYKFEPENSEQIFYGVFDFGGGTTDFDFGIWREANGSKERRYDYVIEHFGAGGDRYLGGENILELLSFEVFKDNSDKLREEGITFVLPPECKKFPGSEVLLSESQEAKLNTRQLMEKLRPIWEQTEGYEKLCSRGTIGVNLYSNDGNIKTNFELNIDEEKLQSILRNRIEKGVINFFESIRLAMNNSELKFIDNKINIFLAGNSSKSNILREIFNEYIEKETKEILNNIDDEDRLIFEENPDKKQFFYIFPPLGTEEAYSIQEELGIAVDKNNLKKPTGKTGVAFGLVQSRNGGKIKVVNRNLKKDEAKFKFFIGEERKKKFRTIIDTDTEYNKWYDFIDASEETFEIYYTTLPNASTNELSISEATRIKCSIDKVYDDENVFVYVRAANPTCIEYVIATQEGIMKDDFLSKITKIQLN